MAGDIESLFTEIEQLLSIYGKLSTRNKEDFKSVLDQKIKSLGQCCADPQASNYDVLEHLIKTKDQLTTDNLDVSHLESAITKMVKQLSAKAGSGNDIDLVELARAPKSSVSASSAPIPIALTSSPPLPRGLFQPVLPTQAPVATSRKKLSVTRLRQGSTRHLSPAEAHKYDLVYDRGARKYELVDVKGNAKATGFSMDNIMRVCRHRNEVVLESAYVHDSIYITFRLPRDSKKFVEDFRDKTMKKGGRVFQ